MEMSPITIPLLLKEQVEEELHRTGMTWNEMLNDFLGKEDSPSVEKPLTEAYASDDHSKIDLNVDEELLELNRKLSDFEYLKQCKLIEMTSIKIPLLLKEQVEEVLHRMGLTWTEMLEDFLGKEASPSNK
ncbi:MAG: hypothetical protein R3Y63_13410 [Eubacteriales bacterium]